MVKVRPGAGRRLRAFIYTLLTTATVLLFTLAKWAIERFISEHNRNASVAIELGIVLVLALLVRPAHTIVEEAIEAAFYRRRRQAVAAMERVRLELTSYRNMNELLRRVMETVEYHGEARACAVYLNRDVFRPEATSFENAPAEIAEGDPLILRFRTSSKPADLAQLQTACPGTHAFPMNAAGELVGFLAVESRHGVYDAEELAALSGLAKDLALAVAAIDPVVRLNKNRVPHNLPADLPALVGRERDIESLSAALRTTRLLTIAGSGGVGKTSVALAVAASELSQHEQGVWFVDFAPIHTGDVVIFTLLSALGGGSAEEDAAREKLLEYIRERNLLLVLDNCEHLMSAIVPVVIDILAQCPRVSVIATSREILHVAGEHVYRLSPLPPESAVELFVERALSVNPAFDSQTQTGAIASICERLDGVPLAIELAAARVRALGPAEILDHLDERFRLLTSGDRAALPRQQTLSATIAWSFELLSAEEQSLFERLAAFRGSFSLAAATAICQTGGACDEYHVLDLLTSLADKSLVTVMIGTATRYRLLESIRAFAAQRAAETTATTIVRHQHAVYFNNVAAKAYHQFDTKLPAGWLERLSPDIDNFRAALEWTLQGDGDRLLGAQLAADLGPLFLRMGLLAEGLRWCEKARHVPCLLDTTAGRIEYVASMMHNNLVASAQALSCAQRAVALLAETSDRRGLIRALSQVAQQYAKGHRFADAAGPAAQAIAMARELGEPRVLATVLRRCAFALPPEQIAQARVLFEEALGVSRSADDREETCFVLTWWSLRESDAGCYDRSIGFASQALEYADGEARQYLQLNIAECAILVGRAHEAQPHAREALHLALESQHQVVIALAAAFAAPGHARTNATDAALMLGFATARLAELAWEGEDNDILALQSVSRLVEESLAGAPIQPLLDRGAGMRPAELVQLLGAVSAGSDSGEIAPDAARDRVGTLLR
jgi:predicted ATPase